MGGVIWTAQPCGCTQEIYGGMKREKLCEHGYIYQSSKAAKPGPRKPLSPGRSFAVTKAQRDKVRGLPCVGCGREKSEYVSIDPAHIWSLGTRCTDPLCIIPLCRTFQEGCHRPYDQRELDLLSLLLERGYYAELGHVISAHQVSPLTLVQRTTGQEWQPVSPVGEAAA